MRKRALVFFMLVLTLCGPLASRARAQEQEQESDAQTKKSPLVVRNAVGTVLFNGLVGGILGLSTLSFYERPQENIRNIFFGAGTGMILSVLYMTLDVAQQPIKNGLKDDGSNNAQWTPYVDPQGGGGAILVYRF
jgi:hypothetical protein